MVQLFSILVSRRVVLLALVDYVIVVMSLVAAVFLIAPLAPTILLFYEGVLRDILISGVLFIFALFLSSLYNEVRVSSRVALGVSLAQVFGLIFLMHSALAYVGAGMSLEPRLLMIGGAIAAPAIYIWRLVYSGVLWTSLPTDRILFIGRPPGLDSVLAELQNRPALGVAVVGYVGTEDRGRSGPKYLGDLSAVEQLLADARATHVVVDGTDLRVPGLQPCLFNLHLRRVPVEYFGTFYERIMRRLCTAELRPSSVIFERELDAKPRSLALQSVYTNLIAFLAAIFLCPFMLLVAFWIRLTVGPALRTRPRLGLNGVPFQLYEFRCHDAHGRATKIGGWLQKRGLEKAPHLLNLLRGELSLIGPAPVRPEFATTLSKYLPYEPQRRTVRPGIISWADLFLSPASRPFDELVRLQYDLYYIKHISPTLDLYILLTTIRNTLKEPRVPR